MKVFIVLCMLVVVSLAEECCRHGDGVTCVGEKCTLATEVDKSFSLINHKISPICS